MIGKNWIRFLVLLGILFAITACSQGDPDKVSKEELITPVHVSKVVKGNLEMDREIIATAEPSQSSPIIPKTAGELINLAVSKGSNVKKGQVIGTIKGDAIQANLDIQEINVQSAQKQLESAIIQKNLAEQGLKNAKEQLEQANVNDSPNNKNSTLNISVENAEQQLKAANVQVDLARLQVEQAKVQLEQSLGNTTIKANAAGEISDLNANVGDLVSNTQPIGTVVSLNPLKVRASVSGEELSLFQAGKDIPIYVKALEMTTNAKISYVSSVPSNNGLYLVEGTLQNKDEKVKPGMMLTYKLPTTVVENTLLIPTAALVDEADGSYVYIVEKKRVVKKPVTVIKSQSDFTAVSGEIKVDDLVVTSGQITLADGNKVTIIEEDAK